MSGWLERYANLEAIKHYAHLHDTHDKVLLNREMKFVALPWLFILANHNPAFETMLSKNNDIILQSLVRRCVTERERALFHFTRNQKISKDRRGSRFIYCIQITRTVSIFYTLAKMEMTQEHVEMEKLINKEDEGRQPTLPNKKGWLAIFILYQSLVLLLFML